MAKSASFVQAQHRQCSSLDCGVGIADQHDVTRAGPEVDRTTMDRDGCSRTSDDVEPEEGMLSRPVYRSFNNPAVCLDATVDTLLRPPAVKARTGLCRTAIYEGMNNGTFPRQRKLSARAVAWSAAAIQQWISTRPYAKD